MSNLDLGVSPVILCVPASNVAELVNARALTATVSVVSGHQVVNVSGELDMRTRHFVEQACLAGEELAVVVEMAELTFMDCRGYAGLIAARSALQAQGRSLTLINQAGQPARLLALLGAEESAPAHRPNSTGTS